MDPRHSRKAETSRSTSEPSSVRLNKFIAAAGVASRRGADALILQGEVVVNGRPVRELGTLVDPERDKVRVQGKLIKRVEKKIYVVLNKPKGYICSRQDEHGRPTVFDLVNTPMRINSVGRLDYDAEGVLVLTNDGEAAHELLHPRYRIPRTYLVKVRGQPTAAALQQLERGVTLSEGWRVSVPAHLEPGTRRRGSNNAWLRMTLYEGRHGQIKEMCEHIGHPVMKIKRIRFGPFKLTGLDAGEWRPASSQELAELRGLMQRHASKRPAVERAGREAAMRDEGART